MGEVGGETASAPPHMAAQRDVQPGHPGHPRISILSRKGIHRRFALQFDQDDSHALLEYIDQQTWSQGANGRIAMNVWSNGGVVNYLAAVGAARVAAQRPNALRDRRPPQLRLVQRRRPA